MALIGGRAFRVGVLLAVGMFVTKFGSSTQRCESERWVMSSQERSADTLEQQAPRAYY